jgi:predicted lactoylglutathione lyase
MAAAKSLRRLVRRAQAQLPPGFELGRAQRSHPKVHAAQNTWPMEQRISLVTLGVKDLARARAFYEALGWGGAQQPDDEVVFFQAGGMVFGLWTALGGHGAPGMELAHNVRSPEEVDAVLAAAARAGGTIARPAARPDWGGYTGAFADTEGYVWEVAHNPDWTLSDDGSVHLG